MTEPGPETLDANTGDIHDLLALETLDDALFRNRVNDTNIRGVLFGGQVLSQALHAATRTAPQDRCVHSLHAYFLRPGDTTRPVLYHVEKTRDGGSFSNRRVIAVQHEKPILHMAASFHVQDDPGFDHETGPRAPVPPPESLLSIGQLAERYPDLMTGDVRQRMSGYRTLDIRPVDPERGFLTPSAEARAALWIRIPSAAGLEPALHACALAYASDSWLVPVTRMPHAPALAVEGFQVASLDHALWFFRPVRTDEWLLYETECPWSGGGRALARGKLYDRDGRIVAAVTQEALLRPRRNT